MVAPSGMVTLRPRTTCPFASFTEIDARTSASLLNLARRRTWNALLQSQTGEVVVLAVVDVEVGLVLLELELLELVLVDDDVDDEVLVDDVLELELLLVEDDVDDDVDELLVDVELLVVGATVLVELVDAMVE